jgi:hypothetical protein
MEGLQVSSLHPKVADTLPLALPASSYRATRA